MVYIMFIVYITSTHILLARTWLHGPYLTAKEIEKCSVLLCLEKQNGIGESLIDLSHSGLYFRLEIICFSSQSLKYPHFQAWPSFAHLSGLPYRLGW